MAGRLGATSLKRLGDCHPKLQRLLREVDQRLSKRKLFDLTVVCGHRGQAEQEQAFQDLLAVADDLDIEVDIGALWKKFPDLPHVELTDWELNRP